MKESWNIQRKKGKIYRTFCCMEANNKKDWKKKINFDDREKEGTCVQVDGEGGEGTCFIKVANSMIN